MGKCSGLDHPGLAKMVAAHAKPPNYMFFFEMYESRNLAEKLHVEEWNPGIEGALGLAIQIGNIVIKKIYFYSLIRNLGIRTTQEVHQRSYLIQIYHAYFLTILA